MVRNLTTFPEIQKKLQAEVDRVVGRDRVPNYEDLANMPYVKAFVRESLRFREVSLTSYKLV